MSPWEIGCLVVMLASCAATIWISRRQAAVGLSQVTGPLADAESRLGEVMIAADERHRQMMDAIARAERAITLQGALKFGHEENAMHSFRDAERLLAGGIPIGEVAERLALPRPEVELLARVRGRCGHGRTNGRH